MLSLVLGIVMILQPDRLSAGDPAFSVTFTLGSSDGSPLAETDIAGLTVHVRASLTRGAGRFTSTPCQYRAATGAYACRVAAPKPAAARVFLTVVEYPNGSGPQVVTVAPTVDASMINPFVVRFR